MLAYLFYDSWLAVIWLLPAGVLFFMEWKQECLKKKEEEFRAQFLDAIQIMISVLKAGYSVENAIRETKKDLLPLYGESSRIHREFSVMIHQMDMNMTAEQVLMEFSERARQEDVENFVTVFVMAKRAGGDSIAILKDTVKIIGTTIETEREIRTILSAKKLEFSIMCLIPMGMVFYIRTAFSEFMAVLYGNAAGRVMMSVCLAVYAAAYYIGRKMIRIEV